MISCNSEEINETKKLDSTEEIKLKTITSATENVLKTNRIIIEQLISSNLSDYVFLSHNPDSCNWMPLDSDAQNEKFEGIHRIDDLDGDGLIDSVFVIPPFTFCDEGDSYYFTNPSIQALKTNSHCCHPQNIFNIGDVDEDGRAEIAQFYSSCSSRYKSVIFYTLNKDLKWERLVSYTFTLNTEYDIYEDFVKMFRVKRKGVFQFLEISDVDTKNELISEWKTFKMSKL